MTETRPSAGSSAGWRRLYPWRPHFLATGGVRQHFVDEGGSGPVFLMVHGNPTWSFYWHRLIASVSTWGRAVAVDHVGCGWSDRPVDYPWSLQTHIDNLVRIVESLDLRGVTLVGHDWGGAIGMGCLQRLPDRFERIVLLNTATFPPPFFPWRIRILRTPVLGRLAVQGANLFARAALRMATELPDGLPRDVGSGLLAPYDSWNNRRAIYEFVRDIPVRKDQPAWKILSEMEAGLAALQQPRLLVWGMRDWCFRPSCLDRLIEHWPDAQVVKLETAGHYVMLDDPEAVISAIGAFAGAPTAGGTVRGGDPE